MRHAVDIYKVEMFPKPLARLVLEMPDGHGELDMLKGLSRYVGEWCEKHGVARENIVWFRVRDDE